MTGLISFEEVSKHKSADSCWVVIRDTVYDVTSFLSEHPGGARAILRLAGTDATEEFEVVHPDGTLEDNMSKLTIVGPIDPESAKPQQKSGQSKTADSGALPALEAQLNLDDFEKTAKQKISSKAWAYYYSASDDLVSKVLNNTIYSKVLLRPRVFVDVTKCDTSSSIQGYKTSLPVFVSPAAMARLAHDSGERGIAQACGRQGALQMISNNASMKFEDIVASPVDEGQKFMFQLYVQNDRAVSEQQLKRVFGTGRCAGVVLTLDAPTPGKREADERIKNDGATFSESSGLGGDKPPSSSEGLGKSLFAGTAADLTWKTTLPWLVKQVPSNTPIILKGVQAFEDALVAAEHPEVTGIILSNHGGRAMDSSQPPLLVLQEIRTYAPEVFDKLEVYVDGGIRRGTDVVKALCLGAKQVGIGRAALYSLAGYGSQGVERVLQILREEIETTMRLLGAHSIDDLGPHCINTSQLDAMLYRPKL